MIDVGNRPLTADRALTIWSAMAFHMNPTGTYDGMEYNFALKSKPQQHLAHDQRLMTVILRRWKTEREFIQACCSWHLLVAGNRRSFIGDVTTTDFEDAFVHWQKQTMSFGHEFEAILSNFTPDDLFLDDDGRKPLFDRKIKVGRHPYWFFDPVLAVPLFHMTKAPKKWKETCKEPLLVDRYAALERLSGQVWPIMKHHAGVKAEVVKAKIHQWIRTSSEEEIAP